MDRAEATAIISGEYAAKMSAMKYIAEINPDVKTETEKRLEREAEAMLMAIDALKNEPKSGHWIKDIDENSIGCSICHTWVSFDSLGDIEDYDPIIDLEMNYCQNCGAKMDDEVSE